MKIDIIKFRLEGEDDVTAARNTARQLCGITGLDDSGQARFAEAVFEVTRNYLNDNKKGTVLFQISETDNQFFVKAVITSYDRPSFKPVLSSVYPLFIEKAKDGTPLKGLAEHFSISSAESHGHEIVLGQIIPDEKRLISEPVINQWKERLTGMQSATHAKTGNSKLKAGSRDPEARSKIHQIEVLNKALRNANDKLQQSAEEQEVRVKERTAELLRSNEELHRSNKDLEQFAYAVSHDLQEPLRKILSYGERLMHKFDGQLGQEGEDYIQKMQDAAARMQSLIEDMLSFSRVGRSKDNFMPTTLNSIINELLGDMEVTIAQKKAEITVEPLPVIEAVPAQMRQLFQNLISNSIKFSGKNNPPRIRISSVLLDNGHCLIYVNDNGIGFREEYSDQIFEIFQRLHTREQYKGSGIGLAICKKILEHHHGSITARSEQGKGSTFIITLPVNRL